MNAPFDFKGACESMLHRLGAVDTDRFYPLRIETAAGPLDLWPQDDSLVCRFVDVERAKALLGAGWGGRLNPISGKWNHHPARPDSAAVDAIRNDVAQVLP